MRLWGLCVVAAALGAGGALVSCSAKTFTAEGAPDAGDAGLSPDVTPAGDGGGRSWCNTPDAGLGHVQCFDFDESSDAAAGWSVMVGTVSTSSQFWSSPPNSAAMALSTGGGRAEARLVERFSQMPALLNVAFDLKDTSPPNSRDYEVVNVAFFAAVGDAVDLSALSVNVGVNGAASLVELLPSADAGNENLPVAVHPLQKTFPTDGAFHRIGLVLTFPAGVMGTANVSIDGAPALVNQPLQVVKATPVPLVRLGLYVNNVAPQVASIYVDNVTMDITGS